LDFLSNTQFENIEFDLITPDENNNWINLTDNDFESLLPLCNKETKLAKSPTNETAVFKLYSNGICTNRDEWVYDFDRDNLIDKIKFFIDEYNLELDRWANWKQENNYQDIKAESNPVLDKFLDERNLIKWSKMIKRDKLRKHNKTSLNLSDLKIGLYRPFVKKHLYFEYTFIDVKGEFIHLLNGENKLIAVNVSNKAFNVLASKYLVDLHFNGDAQCLPFYRYDSEGNRIENITDWGLNQFQAHYQNQTITKLDIFHYTYAVLHNPAYREKYAMNLKRELPRIPFYDNFFQWVLWGKQLMDLHLNFESVSEYPLERIDMPSKVYAVKTESGGGCHHYR